MSFSAVMDEVNPEFDVPTRPVTPVGGENAANSDNNGRKLYYSESINRELNKLSKDLSGICENTVFSSKADRMPPAFGGDSGRFTYEFRRPSEEAINETLHGYQVSTARYTLEPNALPLQHQPGQSNDQMPSLQQPSTILQMSHLAHLPHLVAALHSQQQMAVDPSLLSPATASNSSASPPPGLLEHLSPPQEYLQYLPDIYAPLSAPSSQQNTSGDSAGSPPNVLPNVFSPVPSAEEPPVEETVSESEEDREQDEYQPTPRRPSTTARTNHRSIPSNQKPKTTKARPKAVPEPSRFDGPSPSNSAAIFVGQTGMLMHPSAPDAEANSEYQGSESGGDCSSEQMEDRAMYSGGPKRERSKGQDSKTSRGIGKSSHPYKNFKNLAAQGTGRQMCRYTSPYDGWKCEQILARSYDVPRHMEVHAKEEYELVLTGKLPVYQSELFECVTEANVYVCLVCRKDFSRKDAMQRHVRSSSKMSKIKHRAEAKASLKKRVLGVPITPHPNAVPTEILQRHRRILEKLKVEAQELGQDVTDWDVENMIPVVGDETELFGTGPNAPGIPVGRRGGGKPRAEEVPVDPLPARPTRAANRSAINEIEQAFEQEYPPEPEALETTPKAPTRVPAKIPIKATASSPSPHQQSQQPAKLKLIKKVLRRPSEAPSYGAQDQGDFTQLPRYRASHARTRTPSKMDMRVTNQQLQQPSEPSSAESVEMEQRDSTESEDEEDTYQEESRRRHTDGEERDLMEMD